MFRVLLAVAAWVLVWSPKASATPPLEAYGKLPTVSNVEISPDGANLAMVAGAGDKRQIVIVDLRKGAITGSSAIGNSKLISLGWAGSGYLVVVTSETTYSPYFGDNQHEVWTGVVRDLRRGRWTVLLDKRSDALPIVSSIPVGRIIDGHPVLFFESYHFREGQAYNHPDHLEGDVDPVVYRLDLDQDVTTVVERGGENTGGWILNGRGEAVAREDYNEKSKFWALYVKSAGRWIESKRLKTKIDAPTVMAINADGQSLLVRDHGADDVADWHEVSLATGVWSETLPAYKGVSSIITDPVTFQAIGRTIPESDRDHYRYEFASDRDRRVWALITHAFAGESVYLDDWTDDRSKIVIRVSGPKHGDAYFVVDTQTLKASLVSDVYDGIQASDLNPVRRIDYKAEDGLDIPAYLTTPRGREAKRLPLVVLVHGGPASRDDLDFDWWSQAIASRGYAVLQPQFRGSDGFGEKFLVAGYGEWGGKMISDVSDGVRELVKRGVVDPNRVCIAGGSYGGYAALAGGELDADTYRCIVSVAGVADVRRLLDDDVDNQVNEENATQRYHMRLLGAKTVNDPNLRAISPLYHADKIKAPVLLIHGVDDTVVKYEQSQLMANALRAAGKPVEFVTLKGEDHHLSRGDTRTQMLKAMMTFIEAHAPPDPPKADAGASVAR